MINKISIISAKYQEHSNIKRNNSNYKKQEYPVSFSGKTNIRTPNIIIMKPQYPEEIYRETQALVKESQLLQIKAGNIYSESNAIKESAEKNYQETNNLIKKQIKSIETALKENSPMLKEEKGLKYFDEYENGNLIRRNIYTQKDEIIALNSIQIFHENGNKDIVKMNPDNTISSIDKNCIDLTNSSTWISEHIEYDNNGKLAEFSKRVLQNKNKTEDIDEKYLFYNDAFVSKIENYHCEPSKAIYARSRYIFSNDGKLINAMIGFNKNIEKNNIDIEKEYSFSSFDSGLKYVNQNIIIKNNELLSKECFLFNVDNDLIAFNSVNNL